MADGKWSKSDNMESSINCEQNGNGIWSDLFIWLTDTQHNIWGKLQNWKKERMKGCQREIQRICWMPHLFVVSSLWSLRISQLHNCRHPLTYTTVFGIQSSEDYCAYLWICTFPAWLWIGSDSNINYIIYIELIINSSRWGVSAPVRDCLDQSYNFLIFSRGPVRPVHPRSNNSPLFSLSPLSSQSHWWNRNKKKKFITLITPSQALETSVL